MGFFRDLVRRILFGRPEHKVFWHDRIGQLKTTVRRDRPGKWCLWEGRRLLEGQPKETCFSLSGDSTQPYASLLEQVSRVLDELENITKRVNIELEKRVDGGSLKDLWLSDIGDWDPHDDILQIEYSPVGQPVLENDLEIDWPDKHPCHRLILRATNQGRIAQGQLIERGLA